MFKISLSLAGYLKHGGKKMPKKVPYAVGNFEEIIERDYFFVDKTGYIRELERYKSPVFLRPRRFGKSLWCSILECYYDINRKDKFNSLFGKLAIGKEPTPEKNRYLVMRFNFSKIEVKADIRFIERSFSNIFCGAVDVFIAQYKQYFKAFSYKEDQDASAILSKVMDYIKKNNLPPLYLIIDEYDNFTNQLITTHQDGLYYELTTGDSFFRTVFKVIKAGIEDRTIERVFITGVLPITIDDLTSGFNIAEIITLKKNTLNMLGFTQAEVDRYLEEIYDAYGFDRANMPEVKKILGENYNGYKFLPGTEESLYNSTILTYFLKSMVIDGGEIPQVIIDENLRTDINWVKRLTQREENTKEMLEELMLNQALQYDGTMIRTEFNMNRFFARDFYPLSLFYLGMLTFRMSLRCSCQTRQ